MPRPRVAGCVGRYRMWRRRKRWYRAAPDPSGNHFGCSYTHGPVIAGGAGPITSPNHVEGVPVRGGAPRLRDRGNSQPQKRSIALRSDSLNPMHLAPAGNYPAPADNLNRKGTVQGHEQHQPHCHPHDPPGRQTIQRFFTPRSGFLRKPRRMTVFQQNQQLGASRFTAPHSPP
jgi:hypothetical protein